MKISPAFQLLMLAVAKASTLKISLELPLNLNPFNLGAEPKKNLLKPAAAAEVPTPNSL